MRIYFIGCVEFSASVLQKLIALKVDIAGVATKRKSNFNTDFFDLTSICIQNNIPVTYADNINSPENIKLIKDLNPDIIFCFGWSSLLKREILTLAPMGIIGYHPSALPSNRGRHPIVWALAMGLKGSASSFFFMDEGVDSGEILSQVFFDITYEDDAQTVYNKITNIALDQIEKFLPELSQKTYQKTPQDHSQANIWRKRNKLDGRIDFRMNSEAIYNLIRALTKPYAGAHIIYKDMEIKVWKSREISCNSDNLEPGKVLKVYSDSFVVKTYDGSIEFLEHDFEPIPHEGEYL